jgi:taurine dioxygenase
MTTTTFTVTPVGTAGAAEITGFDAARPLEPDELARFKRAWLQFPILAIRDQHLSAPEQARFTALFGELVNEENRQFVHPDDGNVLILTNELRPDGTPIGVVDAGDFFHADSSHKERPVAMTFLQTVRLPAHGGDTEFANMAMVYDALPADVRRAVEGRKAWHHVSKIGNKRVTISANRPGADDFYAAQARERPAMLQPVVRTHPVSGRKSLYVSPRFTQQIEGLSNEESDAILDRIFALMVEPRFVYRHVYRDGDFVMWDNCCLNHRACGGYALPEVRRMHRTTVIGGVAF